MHARMLLLALALLPALGQAADVLDPKALAALSRMGSYLQGLQRFSLSTRSETDQLLDSGPVVSFAHHTQVLVQQPDKLFVSVDQVAAVPPDCVAVQANGVAYQHCGSTWYQPQYVGSDVRFVVVPAPW